MSEEQKPVEAIEYEDDDWLMALDAEECDDGDLCEVCAVNYEQRDDTQAEILIDSGSEVTVCPKKFADKLGTNQADARLKLRAVDGSNIEHHGQRRVPFELETSEGTQNASMMFQVAGVVRPVASVGELCDKSFDVHFVGGEGWMSKDGKTVGFRRRGNRFMLPITMKRLDGKEYKELCPLDGHDEEELEQRDLEHAEEIDNLGGDAPTMPSARAAKEAAPPTEEQVKTHELTHANYEPWCEHCVAGRGQEAKHLKVKADTQPPDTLVVQMDYLFIAADGSQTAQGRESVTVLVCVDGR